jgi:hypothetical protein
MPAMAARPEREQRLIRRLPTRPRPRAPGADAREPQINQFQFLPCSGSRFRARVAVSSIRTVDGRRRFERRRRIQADLKTFAAFGVRMSAVRQ